MRGKDGLCPTYIFYYSSTWLLSNTESNILLRDRIANTNSPFLHVLHITGSTQLSIDTIILCYISMCQSVYLLLFSLSWARAALFAIHRWSLHLNATILFLLVGDCLENRVYSAKVSRFSSNVAWYLSLDAAPAFRLPAGLVASDKLEFPVS